MKIKVNLAHIDPAPFTTREVRRFAWLPMLLDGYTIWLEYYDTLECYIVKEYAVPVDGGKTLYYTMGAWEVISKRVRQ